MHELIAAMQWSDTTLSYLHVDDSHGRRNGLGGGPIIEEELVEELLLLQQAAQLAGEVRVRAVAQDLVLRAVDGKDSERKRSTY